MSTDIIKPGSETEYQKWAKSLGKEPTVVGTGIVSDRGLQYFGKIQGTAWETNIDDLDGYQILLNQKGVTNINRCYRLKLADGSKCPAKSLTVNTISTRTLYGQVPKLQLGDTVELAAWFDGKYVQFAFKKT